MLHTIISEYDIFYSSEMPEFSEKRTKDGIATSVKINGKSQPYSFFSTNPNAYINPKNKIKSLYYN